MTESTAPRYHPIDMLPVLSELIEGGIEEGRELHQTFLQARDRPHVLDDATVDRAIACHEEALGFIPIYEEQLRRWAASPLTPAQAGDVARLQGLIEPLRRLHQEGLDLARELSKGTIDKVLAKSDEELVLEALMRLMGGGRP